jgi:hypothetical protein
VAIAIVGTPVANGAINGGNFSVNMPTGVAQGDVVYAFLALSSAAGGGTSSSGWTQLGATLDNTVRLQAFRKVMGAVPDTSIAFTGTASASDCGEGMTIAYRGVNQTTPEDTARTTASGNSTNPDPAAIVVVQPSTQVVIFAATRLVDTTGTAAPAGYGNFTQASQTDTASLTAYLADKGSVVAGSENPAVFSGVSTALWGAITVAVRADNQPAKPIAWPTGASTFEPPASLVRVDVGVPRFNDLKGATMIADMVSYSPRSVQLRTEAPPKRTIDVAPATFSGGVWTPPAVYVTLAPTSLVDMTPVTSQPVEAFYPQPWIARAATVLAPTSAAGEIRRPWAGIETFYPRAWLAGASTTRAPSTVGAVLQIVAVVDTFLPRAWLACIEVTLARASIARLTQVVEPAETLLPMAWPARAQTTVEARTWGGEVRRTPQPVETFLPRSWGAQAAIQKALGTGTYLIRVDQPVQEFPYGAWTAHIDVRQLQTTNLNFPGLGSLTVLYPPAEAPITPADVSTWIHRARRRGRR